jgi:hypothetical protein
MQYGVILAKILFERYLNDFLDGNIFMMPINKFANPSGLNAQQYDMYEGIDYARQIKELSILGGSGWVPIGGIQNPLTTRNNKEHTIHILSLYMFTNRIDHIFDEKNFAFGEVAVTISNLKEFINRFKESANALGKHLYQSPVEYVDKSIHDDYMGPFRKFSDYEHQSEFRFVLKSEYAAEPEPIKLPIGDIRDITLVCPSKDLPALLKIKCK